MTPALTPALALRYLSELSADVRGGVVLGDGGERLAGDAELAEPAAGALAAMGAAPAAEAVVDRGAVFAARGDGLALVVVCGPRAIPRLARHDLALVVGDLGGGSGAPSPPARLPATVAEALISAAQRGPGE